MNNFEKMTADAMVLRSNYDQGSPFYKQVDCSEFWAKPTEYKAQVAELLPIEIVTHINELYAQGEL
jgi:hypothetical protein